MFINLDSNEVSIYINALRYHLAISRETAHAWHIEKEKAEETGDLVRINEMTELYSRELIDIEQIVKSLNRIRGDLKYEKNPI